MKHCKRCKEFKSHCTVFIRGRDRAVPCRLHIHILFDSIAVPSSVCWIVTQNAVVFHWNLVCARNANNSLSSSLSSTCCVRRNAMRTKNAALPLSIRLCWRRWMHMRLYEYVSCSRTGCHLFSVHMELACITFLLFSIQVECGILTFVQPETAHSFFRNSRSRFCFRLDKMILDFSFSFHLIFHFIAPRAKNAFQLFSHSADFKNC